MSVALLVPYRPGGFHRERAWRYVRRTLRGLEIVTADSSLADFTRSEALNVAAASTDADLFVLHDTDSLIPRPQLEAGIVMAQESPGLVVPYVDALYLTQPETAKVYRGDPPFSWEPEVEAESHDWSTGGVVVLTRETFEALGGAYDPIFQGWGGGDRALGYLSERIIGPIRRVPGPLWHLWHQWRRPPGWRTGVRVRAENYQTDDLTDIMRRRKQAWAQAQDQSQRHGRASTTSGPVSSGTRPRTG